MDNVHALQPYKSTPQVWSLFQKQIPCIWCFIDIIAENEFIIYTVSPNLTLPLLGGDNTFMCIL